MKRILVNEMRLFNNLNRRQMLFLTGTTVASLAVGYLRGRPVFGASTSAQAPLKMAATTPSCIVRPQQTEGPYFVDEKLKRSDIRSRKQGVPLRLVLRVSRMEGNSCAPLPGATVDIWQCDALGVYSDFQDINGLFDTRGEKFLRGYQVTNAKGEAEFLTIYPGWYPGRTVHIHFKVRTESASQGRHEFTSQLYFDDALTDRVHAQAPYAKKGQRTLRNEGDSIFQYGRGNELILQLTKDETGYAGTFDIALQLT